MKVIHTDNIASVSASGENADFPAANVQTEYRTQPWKAVTAVSQVAWEAGVVWEDGVSWETFDSPPYLEFSVTGVAVGKTMALAIINTNAVRVDVTVTAFGGGLVVDSVSYYTEGDFEIADLWVDYTAQTTTHTVKLEFVPADGIIAQCGAVRIGESLEFTNPKYGLNENLSDTGIEKELNNGATYYEKKSILREFSGSIEIQRDDKFYEFLYTAIRANGQIPMAWLLADDLQDRRWTVFGRPDMPSGSHQYFDFSQVSFKIKEGL
jgi:hypothetical protein